VDTKSITLPTVARSIGVRKLSVKSSLVAWQLGEKPAPEKNSKAGRVFDETHKQKGQVQTLPFGSDVLDVSCSEFLSAEERQTGQTNAQHQHAGWLGDGIRTGTKFL
jgi:hypothetical protein